MALDKQSLSIPFALGLDTKTDPWQVQPGRFLSLVNSVFGVQNQLKKRNAFVPLTQVPDRTNPTTLSTYRGNLVAIGDSFLSYSLPSEQWESKGFIKSISLSVKSLVRSAYSQTVCDSVVSDNGLLLVAFLDGDGAYKYRILDYVSGETLVNSVSLPSASKVARTFVLGRNFIVTFLRTVAATPHLYYISIPLTNLTNPSAPVNVSSLVSSDNAGYDGYVANNNLYLAWDGSDLGGAIRVTYIDSTLAQHNTIVLAGHTADLMSVTADQTGSTPVVWVSAYDDVAKETWSYALNQNLVIILGATQTTSVDEIEALTSTAENMMMKLFYQVNNTYSFSSVRTDYTSAVTLTQAGVVGTPGIIDRSIGLASKAFLVDSVNYFLAIQQSSYQPTYFLIDEDGHVISKLAYSNGSGYAASQVLPSVSMADNAASISYLVKDLLQPVNKSTDALTTATVYTQTGVNQADFDFSAMNLSNVEIGGSLHIAGGIIWAYDGVKPTELGFNLWPEDIEANSDAISGSMGPGDYQYQVTYEWTDGQGNIHRSAPSVPVAITLTTDTEVVLDIPTLRLTYKTDPNAVRIVVYRWSDSQQVFYQVTSVQSPLLNNPAVDSVTYTDTVADSSIIGNLILYTTGGVVENIAPPASDSLALYKSRMFLVDAEDRNLLWFSKQVIESTPVEMSDLFTQFVPPTLGSQGSTGNLAAQAPLDDKLCLFKASAIYYITGNGPDNSGANNDFSEAIFITATVGTDNQASIAFSPNGLVFQSEKGIWQLGRDLSTSYVGSPVEAFNSEAVTSAVSIADENQIRFSISDTISSTLFQRAHTLLTAEGAVLQETADRYIDGRGGDMLMYNYFYDQWGKFEIKAGPVLLSFVSSWFNLAGLQGFERFYWFFLLGEYLSPHKIQITLAFDYNASPSQTVLIAPDNYASPYGEDHQYGSVGPYGGPGSAEQWRIFANKQKCQAFQIGLQEVFDPQFSTIPGPGFTLSGLDLILGSKGSYPRLRASKQIG